MFKKIQMLFLIFLFSTMLNVVAPEISNVLTPTVYAQNDFDWSQLDAYVEAEFGKIIKGTEQAKLVERIGKEITQWAYSTDYEFKFQLIDNDEPNAFAFPNGSIYVLTGLFKSIGSDDDLAFVLGHEVAHVIMRHSEKSQQFKTKISEDPQWASKVKEFSREHEYESDKYGILYMIRAGYSPLGSVNWFNRMINLGYEYPPLYVPSAEHPNFTQRVVQSFIHIGTYYEYAKHFDYGLLYLSMGHWEEAAESFSKFLEKYPHYKEAYNNIAVAKLASQLSQKDAVIDLWINAAIGKVEFFANNFEQPVRGNWTFSIRDFAAAIENLNKAIEYDPAFTLPYINLGLVYTFVKDFKKAKENLDKALSLNPKSYDAQMILGFMYTEQNDYASAANAFNKAVSLDKNNPQAYYNLALSYQWANNKTEAIKTWNDFLALNPTGSMAEKANQNLAALQTGTNIDVAVKTEETVPALTTKLGLVGIYLGDNMDKVKSSYKSPDNISRDSYGVVWEYIKPNITVGFNDKNTVDYVFILEPVKSGLESVQNLNVGSSERDVVSKFGKPQQVFQDGVYKVLNYTNLGIAFWVNEGNVKALSVYKI